MDGLNRILYGKQQTGFLLLSFILTLFSISLGYFTVLSRTKDITAEINLSQIGKFGIVAEYIRNSDIENSEEMIDNLASLIVVPATEQQISTGEESLKKFGYSRDMDIRFNNFYDYIYANQQGLFIGGLLIISALITAAGVIMFRSVQKNLSDIVHYAGNVFDSGKVNQDNPFYGNTGLLHSTITTLGLRFSRLLDSLNEEKKYLKTFISDVSHQMKTPLAVLRMNSEILQCSGEMSNQERRSFLSQSELQLGRLEWLVAGQLRLAKLEANVVDFDFKHQELFETAEIASGYFREIAQSKNISLVNNIPQSIMVTHDRQWLAEALCNIIKNAVENTHSGGNIEISADETPLTVGIYISDNGKGIEPNVLPHIFKRFYTSGSGVSISNIGIGLALSKSIFEKHNAQVNAQSTLGKGTTIRAILFK